MMDMFKIMIAISYFNIFRSLWLKLKKLQNWLDQNGKLKI